MPNDIQMAQIICGQSVNKDRFDELPHFYALSIHQKKRKKKKNSVTALV